MHFSAVMKRSLTIFTGPLLVLSSIALAEEAILPSVDVTPQFVAFLPIYLDSDNDRGASEGRGFRAIYGRFLAEHWYWETDVFGAVLETKEDTITDFYQLGAGTGLSWSLYERSRTQWTPYVIGTVGAVFNDVQPDSDDGGSFTFGAGLGAVSKSLFDNGLKIRGEARYLFDAFNEDFDDIHWSLGLEIPLGEIRTVERVVYVDRVVEVAVEKVIRVSDSDSDGDSVPDSRDQCANTLMGARVDATGCIIDAQTVTFNTITFQSSSAELTYGSKKALAPVAESFNSQKDLKIEIAGHTDSIGSAEYNKTLSQQRADSVRQFFINQGVEGGRLTAVGYGEMQPVTENDTESGRAMNRRVEFRLLK